MSGADHIWSRVKTLFAQGALKRVSDKKVQPTILDDESDTLDNVLRVEPYGLSYRAKSGGQAYVVFPNGDRSLGLCLICGDKRYQMILAEGEVALHDDQGQHVHIQRGGVIEIKANTKVLADCPLFETTQDAKIGGNLQVMGTTTSVGHITGTGGLAVSGGSGATVAGNFAVTGGDVSADSISLKGHHHTEQGDGAPTSSAQA